MPNKMLIDATHPEETRVVVLRGNRVEEFDFESAQRKQLRGNIYLAKVTRVEPSLQAAFVEYGGNRHGFLAFSEIHPDYYQIPVADRQALIEEEERAHRAAEAEADDRSSRRGRGRGRHRNARRRGGPRVQSEVVESETPAQTQELTQEFAHEEGFVAQQHDWNVPADEPATEQAAGTDEFAPDQAPVETEAAPSAQEERAEEATTPTSANDETALEASEERESEADLAALDGGPVLAGEVAEQGDAENGENGNDGDERAPDADEEDEEEEEEEEDEEDQVESVGGADAIEEVQERVYRPRRQYKIQEVIKRRQVLLVQVVKEERGNKGAALTTYLSLAGRYSVLMPNTARGGGISRKITSSQDRARLKDLVQDLDVPEGMGIILRTAGASRTKPEIKRDFEYLLRMWEQVRDLTLRSTAPTLVYEEGSLIKRSIRDLYNKDIEEITVAGEDGYREARDFMQMLMPGHGRAVKQYRDSQPLFSRTGIESQLDAMFTPTVQLRSGGYIVINQTEALVSIDVNSGRATREHHIEDTALKTNLEAAEEVARQLRLRDLAGLIVIDFIDMDEKRNNRAVERKLSECLKHDRARIQVGRISHFGLLEMSRQRIRASVLESSTEPCPHCGGSGHVRSVASVALQLLRSLEETLMKGATHNLTVRTRTDVALYVLNHKRAHLRNLEEQFKIVIGINADATIAGQQAFVVERGEQVHTPDAARALANAHAASMPAIEEPPLEGEDLFEAPIEDEAEAEEASDETAEARDGDGERQRGRRRRRRGRGRRGGQERHDEREGDRAESERIDGEHVEAAPDEAFAGSEVGGDLSDEGDGTEAGEMADANGDSPRGERGDGGRRRRRGRRGGRRRRSPEEGSVAAIADEFENASPADAETAVADLDRPAEPQPVAASQPEPTPQPPLAAETTAAPRKRSTVREPVSFSFSSGAPSSEPTPVPVPAEAETPEAAEPAEPAADTPRRAGWWSRRFGNGE